MTFTVTSDSFKDGDYLPNDFILSADFGFGCAGGNKSPHLKWSGAPCRHAPTSGPSATADPVRLWATIRTAMSSLSLR